MAVVAHNDKAVVYWRLKLKIRMTFPKLCQSQFRLTAQDVLNGLRAGVFANAYLNLRICLCDAGEDFGRERAGNRFVAATRNDAAPDLHHLICIVESGGSHLRSVCLRRELRPRSEYRNRACGPIEKRRRNIIIKEDNTR